MTFVNSTKSPSDGTFVGRTSRNFLWCWLLFFISLLFLWCWLLLFLHFWATFPCHQHATLVSQACEGLHQLWSLPWLLWLLYFCVTFLPRARQFWAGIFYPQAFFTLHSFLTFLPEPAFVKASLGASSSSLKFSGRHADPQNTDWAYLFVWFTAMHNIDIQKNSHLNRIKYYQKLLVVTS